MSASYSVDLGFTLDTRPSLPSASVAADAGIAITSGGCYSSLSGVIVGDIADLGNDNTYCNVYVAGRSLGSGPLLIGVQTSDSTTSGTFTDPTSGLQDMPTSFRSGGYLIIGSGAWASASDPGGIFGSGVSGQMALSGFLAFGAFQRVGRYARLLTGSGFMDVAAFQAGFATQRRTVGSGSFSWLPQSGGQTIDV